MAKIIPAEVRKVRTCLGTLISWMAQSANSPISISEANELLNMLENPSNPGASLLERAMQLHIDMHEKGMTGAMNNARHELIREWRALRRNQ